MIIIYNDGQKEVSVEVSEFSISSQTGFYNIKEVPYEGLELHKVVDPDDEIIDLNLWGFNKNTIIIE